MIPSSIVSANKLLCVNIPLKGLSLRSGEEQIFGSRNEIASGLIYSFRAYVLTNETDINISRVRSAAAAAGER